MVLPEREGPAFLCKLHWAGGLLLSCSGRCYPDRDPSMGFPGESCRILCLYNRPLPGVQALSCLPWPPKAKQAAQKQSCLRTQWGHHTRLVANVVYREERCGRAMGLTQEALEGVSCATFLENDWPCFYLCTLTSGSKPGYYIEWSMEHKKACGVGSWTSPPRCFPNPLTMDSRWTGTPRARSPRL